jgi:hypothetical protein
MSAGMVTRASVTALAILVSSAGAESLVLHAQPGDGAGNIGWTIEGATVGDDLAQVGGTASTYVGKQKNKRLFAPIADTALTPSDVIFSVTVRALTRSDVDMRGTYDGLVVAVNIGGADYEDPAIDEVAIGYGYYEYSWDVNPATAVAWTWADVSALEAGVMTAKSARPTDMVLFADYVEVLVTYGDGNSPPTATDVAASGTTTVGEVVTGTYTYDDAEADPEGTSTFQWYRADDALGTNLTALSGCSSLTCALPISTQGKYVFLEVVPVAAQGVERGAAVISAAIGPVTAPVGTAPVADAVQISGLDTVGATLIGNYTYTDAEADPEGASIYQWVRNGFAVAGAIDATYTLTAADIGGTIVFVVTPVSSTGTPAEGLPVGSAVFGPIHDATGAAPVATGVTVTGTADVGETLHGSYTYDDADADPEGLSTFRWLRDGVGIAGATDSVYVVTVDDAGAMLAFEVTPVAQSGTPSVGARTASAEVGPVPGGTAVLPVGAARAALAWPWTGSYNLLGQAGNGTVSRVPHASGVYVHLTRDGARSTVRGLSVR